MSLNPAFDNYPIEAALIGRMVTSFSELELTFSLIACTAIKDQSLGLRAIYRGRSTSGRIELADVLIRNAIADTNLEPDYEEVIGAMRHCSAIRNNYAHCQWSPGLDGLFFANLEEAASRAKGFDMDQKHVDLKLVTEQEAYFDYTRSLLLYFGDQLHLKLQPRTTLGVPKPPSNARPNLHNRASEHVPHWISEERKRRHLERALEAEGRAHPSQRPPSVLRLTREEWAAKDAKHARSTASSSTPESSMSVRARDYYLHLRLEYQSANIRLIIIAESPPASGKYFYDSTGSPKEPLFAAIMLQLGVSAITKEAGLREMKERGWVLVDATYQPVDKLTEDASHDRDEVITRDYPLLLVDLMSLMPNRSIPLVLIKANVCRTLEPLLLNDGFTVLNCGRVIYFPSHGQQTKFKQQFAEVLSETANSLPRGHD
jgi:hypothetical protein